MPGRQSLPRRVWTEHGRVHYDVSDAPSSDPGTWPIAKNGAEPKQDEDWQWPIYSADELGQFPPVEWLIPGWLAAKQLTGIYGEGGTYKSFVALTMGLQLAFRGRTVVYIAAEGMSGLRGRVLAWQIENEVPTLPTFFAVREPVPLHEENAVSNWRAEIEAQLQRRGVDGTPDLVVVDTLARNFVGGSENRPEEMGLFVDGCEQIRNAMETAVVVIHHTPVGESNRERGTAAFRTASFAMFGTKQKKPGRRIEFKCDRMKELDQPKALTLEFKKVWLPASIDMDWTVRTQRPPSSLVLIGGFPPTYAPESEPAGETAGEPDLDEKDRRLVRRLVKIGKGQTIGWCRKVLKLQRTATQRRLESLMRAGFIERTGENVNTRYHATDRAKAWAEK
jgi:AAA domain